MRTAGSTLRSFEDERLEERDARTDPVALAAAHDGLGASLAILGGNALAIILGIHWWRTRTATGLAHGSIALGILGLAAVATLGVAAASTIAPNGLIERIAVYTVTLWQLRVALHLATTSARAATAASRPHRDHRPAATR